MSQQSNIEWTDATWNPVRGCVKVSPGCAHCYAETFAERWRGVKGHPYEQGFDLRLMPEKLNEPLTWKKPRRVFVNSMSDLFQDGVPDQFLHDVYHIMEQARQHTFQVLTKRAARMQQYLEWRYGPDADVPHGRIPSRHIWHGVSVENQPAANERVPLLMHTRSAVRFLSVEPLLSPVNLDGLWGYPGSARSDQLARWPIHWVIVGGESGPKARGSELGWYRDIVAQCRAAHVPVFVKQLGRYPCDLALHDRKGGDMTEWPEDLRVREFPCPSS